MVLVRPQSTILRMVTVWLAIAGVLVLHFGPAWRAFFVHDRPLWSVCGQDLCLCQPVPMEPDCPLCLAGDAGGEGCSGVGIDPSRIPVGAGGSNPSDELLAGPGRAGEGVLVALMVLCAARRADMAVQRSALPVACDSVGVPDGAPRDVPTPPPRA
jgi:hypothetical protein